MEIYLERFDPTGIYVYYYKEDTDELVKVAMEIQANDGFYEFYISHNSKYIVSSKEIKTKAVSTNTDMLSLNNQVSSSSDGLPIVLILATIAVVLAIVLLVVLLSKDKKNVVAPNNLQ